MRLSWTWTLKCGESFQPENPILINFLNWIFPIGSFYCFCSNISIRHTWAEIDGAQSSKELHSSTCARTQRLQRAMVASFSRKWIFVFFADKGTSIHKLAHICISIRTYTAHTPKVGERQKKWSSSRNVDRNVVFLHPCIPNEGQSWRWVRYSRRSSSQQHFHAPPQQSQTRWNA